MPSELVGKGMAVAGQHDGTYNQSKDANVQRLFTFELAPGWKGSGVTANLRPPRRRPHPAGGNRH